MRRLTLIRHGLTEGNVRRWYYGALDLPLCEAGQAAVQEAAAGGLYPPYSGERILTSGMLRTEQTLRLIYGAAIWGTLQNGLQFAGAPVAIRNIIIGIIVVLSVLMDVVIRTGRRNTKGSD